MVKLAVTSDNHIDINQLDMAEILAGQAAFLIENQVDIYLIAGDLFNDFRKGSEFVTQLQSRLPKTVVKFIAGNHDMLKGISYADLERPVSPEYLHNQYFDVPGTNWRIIGNNGWYDYRFADGVKKTPDQFAAWKRAYSVDGQIKQPMSDPNRLAISLEQTTSQFEAAKKANKRVFFMTHFVPDKHFVHLTQDNRFWNVYVGLLGSPRMGELIQTYQVEKVLFGHLHVTLPTTKIGVTDFYNQAVGYGTKRHNEWTHSTFLDEWRARTKMVNLDP